MVDPFAAACLQFRGAAQVETIDAFWEMKRTGQRPRTEPRL